jgi:hypothetical protein
MKRRWMLLSMLALLAGAAGEGSLSPAVGGGGEAEDVVFEQWFGSGTMRVDLFHTATATSETVGLDEVVLEPVWAGGVKHLVDTFGYGKYRFEVHDAASGRLIFSQGFCTLLSEWQTTLEAQSIFRTMSESLRFPAPRKTVRVDLDSRDKMGTYKRIFSLIIDPASTGINRGASFGQFQTTVVLAGTKPPRDRVDIVILPDGYTQQQAAKMLKDAGRFASMLFEHEPFGSRRDAFAVTLVQAFSNESGADEPRKGIFRDTLLGTSFNTFDSERYLTTADNKTLRRLAALAPYDIAVVMVNSARYGGGGIYNSWCIFTADNEYDDYVFIHEFGHAFAGLGDEYFQSGGGYDEDEFYPPGVEPWEPNLSAFIGGKKESIKWKSLIGPGVPLPTPDVEKWRSAVGLFEGAGYKSKGLYRGAHDCKMFHKGLVSFCPVCRGAIEAMIRYWTGG